MRIPSFILLTILAITPVLAVLDGLLAAGMVQIVVAAALASVALAIRPGETGHLLAVASLPVAAAALVPVWMAMQLIPLPVGGLSRSIWDAAGQALGDPLMAGISIDPGLTLLAALQTATFIALVPVAAAVAIERAAADRLLMAIAVAALAIAVLGWLPGLDHLPGFAAERQRAPFTTAGVIGAVAFAAIIVMTIERHFTRNARKGRARSLALGGTGLAFCAASVMATGPGAARFALAGGLATVAGVYFVRKLGLGVRAALALTAVLLIATATVAVAAGSTTRSPLPLRYAVAAPDVSESTARMIGEAGLGGVGAGAFGALARIHGLQGASGGAALAPTFAAQVAVELGQPMLWLLVAMALGFAFLCVHGAFERGRDFFHPLTGAGMAVGVAVMGFCDNSLCSSAIAILVAATGGLALAQRRGRL